MTDTDKTVKLAVAIIVLFVAVGMFYHLYGGVQQAPSAVAAPEVAPPQPAITAAPTPVISSPPEVPPIPLEEADTTDMGPPIEYAPMPVQVQVQHEEMKSEVQVMQGVLDELEDRLREPGKLPSLPKGYTPQL